MPAPPEPAVVLLLLLWCYLPPDTGTMRQW